MYTVIETDEFSQWLGGLKDRTTRIRLARRLNKARRGNLGDINSVGEGVMEMREFFGPGWRLYYVERGARRRTGHHAGRWRQIKPSPRH